MMTFSFALTLSYHRVNDKKLNLNLHKLFRILHIEGTAVVLRTQKAHCIPHSLCITKDPQSLMKVWVFVEWVLSFQNSAQGLR